jgi:hypothetical protein
MNMMSPISVYVAAREVLYLAPGESVDLDAHDVAFPRPLSQAPAGNYRLQAVPDVHHSYNYDGRAPGDILSAVVPLSVPFAESVTPYNRWIFVSTVLTSFWGRDVHMRGWVLLPPGYAAHPENRYPTVYFTHGFGGTLAGLRAGTLQSSTTA